MNSSFLKSTPRIKENPEEDKEIDLPILLLEDINFRGVSNANTTSKKSPAKKIET